MHLQICLSLASLAAEPASAEVVHRCESASVPGHVKSDTR